MGPGQADAAAAPRHNPRQGLLYMSHPLMLPDFATFEAIRAEQRPDVGQEMIHSCVQIVASHDHRLHSFLEDGCIGLELGLRLCVHCSRMASQEHTQALLRLALAYVCRV